MCYQSSIKQRSSGVDITIVNSLMRSNEILCHIDVALFTLHVGDGCGGKRALHVDLALPVTIGPRRNADGNPRTTLI